jgi:RNA polymerase sigma-70 factor, ECF subfamily
MAALDEIKDVNQIQSDLILKIGRGDRSSLIALYEKTSSLVFGLICRIVGDQASSEEVLLDTYTEIWKQSAGYNPDRFTPMEWMMTIARSRAIAGLHSGKVEKRNRKVTAASEQPDTTVVPEQQQLARTSLEALPPAQREVLDWACYSGLSCGEIAAQLGQPLGAVKNHIRMGMNRMIELLYPSLDSKP